MENEKFDAKFQRALLSTALRDHALRGLLGRLIDEGHLTLTDPVARWVQARFQELANPTEFQLDLLAGQLPASDPVRRGWSAFAQPPDPRDSAFLRDQLVQFAREQTYRRAFSDSATLWNSGRKDEALAHMAAQLEEIKNVRLDTADRGWFFKEYDARSFRRQRFAGFGKTPTGVAPIDVALGGGIANRELGVIFGYSSAGKSLALVHLGAVACRCRRRVLHFQLEGSREQAEDRYEAWFADALYRTVQADELPEETVAKIIREYGYYQDNLVIRGFGEAASWHITLDHLLAEVIELRTTGWDPDVIIVDYGDLVWSNVESPVERQTAAFRGLKTLASKRWEPGFPGYAVWTASQAQRPKEGSTSVEHVLTNDRIADSYGKTKTADVMISINRSEEEEVSNHSRWSLVKNRDGTNYVTVRVETKYAHTTAVDLKAPMEVVPHGGGKKTRAAKPPPTLAKPLEKPPATRTRLIEPPSRRLPPPPKVPSRADEEAS